MKLKIVGTTFSGNAIRTTWGNTLRMICYRAFSADHVRPFQLHLLHKGQTGMASGWCCIIAAGDDCVMFCNLQDLEALLFWLGRHNSPNMTDREYGLGQCVKEYIKGSDFTKM